MKAMEAVDLIRQVHFRPGWTIEASVVLPDLPFVTITAYVETVNSDRENALRGYPEQITIAPDGILDARAYDTDDELYGALLSWLIALETHECREFFRVGPQMDAPFHPHRPDGVRRWDALV